MKQPSRIFQGKVGNGKLWLEQREDFARLIQSLDGKDIEVILRKRRKPRTLKQNSWYWVCIIPMVREAGGFDNDDEAHEAMKIHFLTVRKHSLPTVRSTTSLDTGEMVEYCESIRRLGAQMWGIDIPDPVRAAELGFSAG
jgi:hypothetical protein